jgi:hypothetical protein
MKGANAKWAIRMVHASLLPCERKAVYPETEHRQEWYVA